MLWEVPMPAGRTPVVRSSESYPRGNKYRLIVFGEASQTRGCSSISSHRLLTMFSYAAKYLFLFIHALHIDSALDCGSEGLFVDSVAVPVGWF